jgi:hypothetical protein
MAVKSMRDRIREQAQQSTSEGASYLKLEKKTSFFSPKADEYEIDVIPYENSAGELEAFKRYKVHAGIGAEDRKYVCPTSIGKKCPICEERARMNKSANADPDLIKALAPKERTLIQVIDLKEEKKGIQLFDHSYHLFAKKLLADIEKSEHAVTSKRKRSTAHAGFAELEGGQTLIASFIEKKMGSNKFYECDRIDAEDRDDYADSILDDGQNLDECLKVLGYEELEAIFLELDPEEQGANRVREEKKEEKTSRRSSKHEEEEEAPKRSRGRKEEEVEEAPPTRRRGKVEEKEEEAVEEEAPKSRRGKKEEPVEDDDSATVATTRRGKKAEAVVEEVEEEAPTRRRASKTDTTEVPKGKCYVKGGVFGKDCDTHTDDSPAPNCYDCPEDTWKECKAEQIRLSK